MKIIEDIRNFFGQKLLKTRLDDPRTQAVHNFANARSVAVIYREKGESYFILVKQYVKYLRTEHGIRDIMAMGYIHSKKAIPHYHVHRLKYDYFTLGDLDWRMEPNCDQVRNFVNQEFDILIDFEKEPTLPLRFVLAASRAKLKVGYYQARNEPFYDLMFHTQEQATFDEYISQVNHYLNLINTELHERA